jgi:hypothetical protein
MLFDELRAVAAAQEDVVVPASWDQGRTVYGGLSAGLLCDAVSQGVDPDRPLRYLKVGFLRPLETDKPFRIELEEVSRRPHEKQAASAWTKNCCYPPHRASIINMMTPTIEPM